MESDLNKPRAGEPAEATDEYDRAHGDPCEKDYRANPPVATPDPEPKMWRAS